jgi:hypothetical protein
MALVRLSFFLLILFSFKIGYSQINSPYSRYGLGDLYNSRNVLNKAMGNLATPVYDYQAVNFINPASYSRLAAVTFDVGAEYESRKLAGQANTSSYRSNNLAFNYLALGLPLLKAKDGTSVWGMALGLRPITRMNYNISESSRNPDIDSIYTTYKGSGGASSAYIGTGFRFGGFAVGVNIGFLFGQHTNSTQTAFINDSVQYFPSNQQSKYSYSKFNVDGGFQWDIKVAKKTVVRLAASGYLGGNVNLKSDFVRETIFYSTGGGFDTLDVVKRENNVRGQIKMPAGYTLGIAFEKTGVYTLGAEYEHVNWSDYLFNGQKDQVENTSMLRFGGQWTPAQNTRRYLNRITYRAGFYTGKDYIKVGTQQLPIWAATFGFGLPVRRWNAYSNQFTVINTAFEIGKRGNKNFPVAENIFRFNIGLCLSDIWFNKRRYD